MIRSIIVVLVMVLPSMVGVISSGFDTVESDHVNLTDGLTTDDSKIVLVADYATDKTVAILAAIANGTPIISKNSDDFKSVGSSAFYDNSTYYGYYHSPNGVIYCYSADSDNNTNAYRMAVEWASSIQERSYAVPSSIDDGTTVISEKHTQCDDRGMFSISTVYSYIGRDDGWDYWTVKYYMESNPQNGYQTASMKVYDDLNVVGVQGKLLRHGPNTTTGTSTSSVSVTLSTTGFSASVSTEYSIPDVSVINDSSIGLNKLLITHQISRESNAAKHTYYCEPIAIFKCDPGDSDTAFCPVDEYTVTYEKNNKVFGYINNWSVKSYDVRLQAILYPDR